MAHPYASSMLSQQLGAGPSHRHREVAAEFPCEIDRDTGVYTALAVQELGTVVKRHDRSMPNVWMDIKAAAALTPERDELLWRHIVPRQCEWHDKTLAMQRIEAVSYTHLTLPTN